MAPLTVAAQLVRFDLWVMLGVSAVVLVVGLDGASGRVDGVVLVVGAVAYTAWLMIATRRHDFSLPSSETRDNDRAIDRRRRTWPRDILLVIIGLAMLTLGARWLVDGAVTFARLLHISKLVIGLTRS